MSFFYFLIINFDWYKYFPLLGLAFVTFGNLEVAKRVRKDHTRLCCGHANPQRARNGPVRARAPTGRHT